MIKNIIKNIAIILIVSVVFFTGSVEGSTIHITNCTELQDIRNDPAGDYILINDIDCIGYDYGDGGGFMPIAGAITLGEPLPTPFTGTLDGGGHTINGLSINRSDKNYIGLFGIIEESAKIKDLNLVDVEIIGRAAVGGLIGRGGYNNPINSEIRNVHITGNISGYQQVGGLGGLYSGSVYDSSADVTINKHPTLDGNMYFGGLLGNLFTNGSIIRSSSAGSVTGGSIYGYSSKDIGGLVGINWGTIEQSFSTADVSGRYRVGGFVGDNYMSGQIFNSYATGNVNDLGLGGDDIAGFVGLNYGSGSRIENSYSIGFVTPGYPSKSGGFVGESLAGASCISNFWDNQTSGLSYSTCGQGKTTAEMQIESTFTEAGWDFINIWELIDYPHLQWERIYTPTVSISTDSFQYSPGDLMNVTLNIDNPTANPVTFDWYIGVPHSNTWVTCASAPIPAGYNNIHTILIPVGNWGPSPFGIVHYVHMLDSGTGEVLVQDATTFAYSPGGAVTSEVDIAKKIKKSIKKVDIAKEIKKSIKKVELQ